MVYGGAPRGDSRLPRLTERNIGPRIPDCVGQEGREGEGGEGRGKANRGGRANFNGNGYSQLAVPTAGC